MACPSVKSCSCSWQHFIAGCVTGRGHCSEPADLQLHFPKTFLEFIVITNIKRLDPDQIKTAEELDVLLLEDSELFIEVSVLCPFVFLSLKTADSFSAKTRTSAAKKICCGSSMCACPEGLGHSSCTVLLLAAFTLLIHDSDYHDQNNQHSTVCKAAGLDFLELRVKIRPSNAMAGCWYGAAEQVPDVLHPVY